MNEWLSPDSSRASIGVLDSGAGGLSVLREIHRLFPDHPTIYFADQAHLPYGARNADEIRRYVLSIVRFLLKQGAVVVVVACNAASAASLHYLRQRYPHVPFVGMEPAVKPAVLATRSNTIGVLTTQATADGVLYKRVVAQFGRGVRVITQVAPDLVQIVETGDVDTAQSRQVIRENLQPMLDAGADQIALACTHFSFLVDTIKQMIPAVNLIDPGPAVARQVTRVWPDDLVPQTAPNRYYSSADPERFRQMLWQLVRIDATVAGTGTLPA